MTLQQLDEALKAWRGRLSAIAENLLELQTDLTFQSLTGTGGLGEAQVTGATAARCQPALRTVHDLFRQFGLLQATVDRAEALRKDLPSFFGGEARLLEAQQLLFARSIEVETDDVPLGARQLDSEARVRLRLTPEELLGRMMASFAGLRDAVAQVGAGWAECGRKLEWVESELGKLRAQTALPSRLLAADLQGFEMMLDGIRTQMRSDPLGAMGAMETHVEPALARAGDRLARAERVRTEVRAAHAVWQGVHDAHARARDAFEAAQGRFAQLSPALVEDAKAQALGAWLDRLERHAAEGSTEAVSIGLRNWLAAAEECRRQDAAVIAQCSRLLEVGEELRGRMGALAAKARVRGLAEAEDAQRLRNEAETLLRAVPIDLDRAAVAVASFERRIRQAGADSQQARSSPTA